MLLKTRLIVTTGSFAWTNPQVTPQRISKALHVSYSFTEVFKGRFLGKVPVEYWVASNGFTKWTVGGILPCKIVCDDDKWMLYDQPSSGAPSLTVFFANRVMHLIKKQYFFPVH